MTEALNPFEWDMRLLESVDQVSEFIEWLQRPRTDIGIDTETSGLDRWDGVTRLVQFGDDDSGWAIPADQWKGVIEYALDFINKAQWNMLLQNCKFDIMFLFRYCGWLPANWGRVHDTQVIASLVDFGVGKGLKELAVHYVTPMADAGQGLLKDDMRRGGWDWATVPVNLPSYWVYAVLDTILTVRLYRKLVPRIAKFRMEEAYRIEQAVVEPLFNIERNGMLLDREYATDQIANIAGVLDELETIAFTEYGLDNMNSGDQIAQCFQANGITLSAKTKTGKWKTDKDTLAIIALDTGHPLAGMVTKHRKLAKFSSTYYANAIKFQGSDGRVHPSYRQMQARTHRMSVTGPAMQTWPRPGTDKYVRNAIMAAEGNVLMSCDLSNIEARIFATIADVIDMRRMMLNGEDIHGVTAERIYHLDGPAPKDSPQRQIAKNALFAILFGSGVDTLAITAGVPTSEAREAFDGMHKVYPEIKRYSNTVSNIAKENKEDTGRAFITLADGRQLSLGSNDDRYYALTNWSIQGEAACIMKRCLINAQNMGLAEYMVGCVHDEIILETPEDVAEEASHVVVEAMEDEFALAVPILAECGAPARRWGDAK